MGILSGNVYNMGDFDECVSVKGPWGIEGKYCLAKVDIIEPPSAKALRRQYWNGSDVYGIWLDPLTSMWEQIEYKGDRSKHRKDSAYWAMCVPSSCTAHDVELAMGRVLPPLAGEMGINLKVNVHPTFCTAEENNGFTAGDWVFW
ncbi:hypothetical protein J437_LFUL014550 [Ladona fulva]|uniref:Nose resistant-to-fluoxetine protein N-terminal domain-containing protein n=1 Tax=Ladona fulva TaxID=123851 RepID=A0A8K0KN46_LADFU|nr:hypothetical protein J437_LFUL014550 [Ladona fulva]